MQRGVGPSGMKPLYVVDGFNFLHAVVLRGRDRARWWSPENQARAVEFVAALAASAAGGGLDVWVVFDQRGARPESDAGLREAAKPTGSKPQVHHAPDADDYIVERCAELCAERPVIVVSADRSLRDRAKNHGATGLSPWAFAGYGAGDSGGGGLAPPGAAR